MDFIKIKSIRPIGKRHTFDLQVQKTNNFYLSNGILSHNSGKGESMKATNDLVTKIGNILSFNSTYTTKMTTAGCVGGLELMKVKNKINIQKFYGALRDQRFIFWDEGSVLFKNLPFMEDIRDALNMAMDEPGLVHKRLKHGELKYRTNCTITAGSYIEKNIQSSILQEGFVQRTFLSYKEFSEQELDKIDDVLMDLTKVDHLDVVNMQNKFKDIFLKVHSDELKKYKYTNQAGKDSYFIRIDPLQLDAMKEEKKKLKNKFFRKQFSDDKQIILDSYYARLQNLLMKIASQYAIMHLKDKVDLASFQYACKVVEWHCESILELLMKVGKAEKDQNQKRIDVIMSVLKQNNNRLNRQNLIQILSHEKKRNRWDLGYNRTCFLIELMIKKNLIEKKNGQNKSIIYEVC